eukprot:m.218128 g.218128  ORF g.218128 m.218128 type:complete len:107 (-) comp29451_c0_seq1:116-436(-)
MMVASLAKFDTLPDATLVYCGHEYTLSNLEFALTIEPDNPMLQQRSEQVKTLRAHGDPTIPTTLGIERACNPFLRCHEQSVKDSLGMPDADHVDVFAELRARKDNF